jgi:hypothetical protein
MFKALAIWYLRKKKISVLMNYQIDNGKIRPLTHMNCMYDNNLNNVDVRSNNNQVLVIPEGKFCIKQ